MVGFCMAVFWGRALLGLRQKRDRLVAALRSKSNCKRGTPTRKLGGQGGEQRAHVLRFTRADVYVARRPGSRDDDSWRTGRCSMRE